jgi:hypothetical protein
MLTYASKVAFGLLLISALELGAARAGSAQVVNPGFETGDLTGWTASIPEFVSVVNAFSPLSTYTITPREGEHFAVLSSGTGDGPPEATVLFQSFTGNAGDVLHGSAFFATEDTTIFNDTASIVITHGGSTEVFHQDVASVGDQGHTGWVDWSYVLPAAGSYKLEASVVNGTDNSVPSYLGIDAHRLPESGTLALSLLALVPLLGGLRWRREA